MNINDLTISSTLNYIKPIETTGPKAENLKIKVQELCNTLVMNEVEDHKYYTGCTTYTGKLENNVQVKLESQKQYLESLVADLQDKLPLTEKETNYLKSATKYILSEFENFANNDDMYATNHNINFIREIMLETCQIAKSKIWPNREKDDFFTVFEKIIMGTALMYSFEKFGEEARFKWGDLETSSMSFNRTYRKRSQEWFCFIDK